MSIKHHQSVRGMKDLIGEEFCLHQHISETAKKVGELYGFSGLSTPLVEFTDVYKRTLGESSDVVNKEMYSFDDRNGESLTLRPEFTAGVVRAFIANGWQQKLPLRLFSTGPLFRYERPQKGRQRQFTQVNFEALGSNNPLVDVEMIALGQQLLSELGICNYSLELNSLGDADSRKKYTAKLIEYFTERQNKLSADSKERLHKNPLRILDSKDKGDQILLKDVPKITECLSDESAHILETVTTSLSALNIDYRINERIVRGLDYYNDIVFEFVSHADETGAQNTILAGGRYDGLVKTMGGPPTPAVGFAAGVERLALLAKKPDIISADIAIMPLGNDSQQEAVKIASQLRQSGQRVEILYSGNMKKKLQRAVAQNVTYSIIIGSEELEQRIAQVRIMSSGEQEVLKLDSIVDKGPWAVA